MSDYTIRSMQRHDGIAGQFTYIVNVEHKDGTLLGVTFASSIYGGPIVVATDFRPSGIEVSPSVRERCGSTLTEQFIENFYNV